MKQPGTRRVYRLGPNQPDVCGQHIEALATAAVQQGCSLAKSCPYPFSTEAGQQFVSVYFLNRHASHRTAQVLARSAHALRIAQPKP